MKAFLGMGLLGSNFVKAMRKKGDEVQVWNRTPSRARALESEGAKVFVNVTDAVKGADIVHLTLRDDGSIDEVLKNAEAGLEPGALIIDHTTTSVDGAIARTRAWKAKGFTYLHAPVFMGPPNALESTGYMLVSGDQDVIKNAAPELSKMTGKLLNLGSTEGKAAGMKLAGNLFLQVMTVGISDMLALAKGLGISGDEIQGLFSEWNPAAAMPARMKRILSGNFDQPSWELVMARKDSGLMITEAEKHNAHLAAIPAIAAEMDKWIEKGYGSKDWSVIAKDNI
ncbi:NAD(P)-dependent oxidoreductase [Mucilaginibacter sp. BT774]|uniref:NAD(P)-dependent oxidoreductase n=1 Tax=Mucilaginibacter sp. BT774 TaxID=3062276 RepID=UPI002676D65F|nr:NAD(P)-dependent oxidoreductase [Mucilaginibacter sp. BT774]MDO3629114.1 NAD(P)-dependent oxidoreductase [Mucilaginibacter sp. BT774]